MTEGCRGEGGILVNKTATAICKITAWAGNPLGEPKNKYMELGPRQSVEPSGTSGGKGTPSRRRAAWSTSISATSARKLLERLPFICELAKAYVGVDR